MSLPAISSFIVNLPAYKCVGCAEKLKYHAYEIHVIWLIFKLDKTKDGINYVIWIISEIEPVKLWFC